jgi:hypothetical protein
MPLSFESQSHGQVAFGFFNIDSDMLLLERYFFFADRFCSHIEELLKHPTDARYQARWAVYEICEPQDVGDLMGAIHGIRFTGFIGALYRRFPFPTDPAEFRQKPEGFKTQSVVKGIITRFAGEKEITCRFDRRRNLIDIGPYRFTARSFQLLINYVWQGGYPRWKNGVRPAYILALQQAVDQSNHPIVKGLQWES